MFDDYRKITSLAQKAGTKVLGIIAFVVVLVLGNALLLGGQELYHSEDNKKLADLKGWLDYNKTVLEGLKKEIDSDDSRLSNMKAQMKAWELQGENDKYNNNVSNYNGLVKSYNAKLDKYESLAVEYNAKADEYNKLAKDTGSRWYIAPIPGGKGIHAH